jgi:hypothetical protein
LRVTLVTATVEPLGLSELPPELPESSELPFDFSELFEPPLELPLDFSELFEPPLELPLDFSELFEPPLELPLDLLELLLDDLLSVLLLLFLLDCFSCLGPLLLFWSD